MSVIQTNKQVGCWMLTNKCLWKRSDDKKFIVKVMRLVLCCVYMKFPLCGWNNQLLEFDVSTLRWSLLQSSASTCVRFHWTVHVVCMSAANLCLLKHSAVVLLSFGRSSGQGFLRKTSRWRPINMLKYTGNSCIKYRPCFLSRLNKQMWECNSPIAIDYNLTVI